MASRAHEAEATVASATVMSNSVTPYMTVDLRVSDGRLRVRWTEATLGVIPRRRRSLGIPLDDIRELRVVHEVIPLHLLIAVAVAGAAAFSPPWLQLPLLPLAVLFLLVGVIATLRITWDAGRLSVPVCALQRHRIGTVLAVAADQTQGRA